MEKTTNKFWDKVSKCKHEPNNNYLKIIHCGTPYCEANEWHCKHCGAFITECGCGFCNSISGWSEKRYNAQFDKKKNERKI